MADLRGSKFFQFHAVFGKIWQNDMLAPLGELAPPPRGNPGSATGSILDNLEFATLLQTRERFLPSATKLRRLCFYTCLSVHRGSVSVHARIPPPGNRHPPPSRHPPRSRPPWTRHPPRQTATAADGTHPTGMHSCFSDILVLFSSFFNRESTHWKP